MPGHCQRSTLYIRCVVQLPCQCCQVFASVGTSPGKRGLRISCTARTTPWDCVHSFELTHNTASGQFAFQSAKSTRNRRNQSCVRKAKTSISAVEPKKKRIKATNSQTNWPLRQVAVQKESLIVLLPRQLCKSLNQHHCFQAGTLESTFSHNSLINLAVNRSSVCVRPSFLLGIHQGLGQICLQWQSASRTDSKFAGLSVVNNCCRWYRLSCSTTDKLESASHGFSPDYACSTDWELAELAVDSTQNLLLDGSC